MTPRLDTAALAELIRRKHEAISNIHRLVSKQQELVEAHSVSKMMSLLAAKQGLLDGLQEIERALAPFRAEDPERRRWPSADARNACREQADDATRLLQEILDMERDCERLLHRQRDGVSELLSGTQAGREANQAYLQASTPRSTRLDLSSEQ